MPQEVKTFVGAFHRMDARQQKAQLQTILKAAHIYRDARIELFDVKENGTLLRQELVDT